jgi:hypothetical protein
MLRSLAVVAFVVVCALTASLLARTPAAPAARARVACGIERWSVKTLTDGGAKLVRQQPRRASISYLRSLPQPPDVTYDRTHDHVELQVFRISAILSEAKDEDDGDMHLIVGDPAHASATLVVEFPAAACARHAPARLRRQMSRARSAFIRACGGAGYLHGAATITGVGFWDRPHASGAAPNGIELHPVLSFKGKCRP